MNPRTLLVVLAALLAHSSSRGQDADPQRDEVVALFQKGEAARKTITW